jgi:hypothetical protein
MQLLVQGEVPGELVAPIGDLHAVVAQLRVQGRATCSDPVRQFEH